MALSRVEGSEMTMFFQLPARPNARLSSTCFSSKLTSSSPHSAVTINGGSPQDANLAPVSTPVLGQKVPTRAYRIGSWWGLVVCEH